MEATHVQCSISDEFIPIEQAVLLHNGDIADKELDEVVEVDGEFYNSEDDDVCYVDSRDEWYHTDYCTFSNCMGEWVHDDDGEWDYDNDDFATPAWFEDNDYDYIEYGQASGRYLHNDVSAYCEDIGAYVHGDDAHWDEDSDCCYFNEDNIPNRGKDCVSSYHGSPCPEDLSNNSQFKIGIEIEKNSIMGSDSEGDEIGAYDLFKGFEKDSSCGVEAITNILPLDDIDSDNEKKVFEMFEEARDVIDEEEVDDSCGGHMTVSCSDSLSYVITKGKEGEGNSIHVNQQTVLREKMRINSAIVYALYRYRLKNSYCENDKDMKRTNPTRYTSVLPKNNNTVEFRLFSRIKNVEQLKLRYRLMYQLMNHSINKNSNYSVFLLSVLPILREMYDGNDNKLKEVIRLSYKFKSFLELGYVDEEIREFLSEYYKPKSKIQLTLCV
jgi:hypothetical protein